jgi:uncharacterized repeat protein (TIGR01451 family)
VSDPNPADMSADIAISVAGPSNYKKGSNASYNVTVTNNGPSNAGEVVVFSTTPAGVTFASSPGDCSTGFPCSLSGMAAGTSKRFTVAYSVPSSYSGDSLQLTMVGAPPFPDPVLSNNAATVNTPQGGGCSSAGLGEPMIPAALLLLAMCRRRRTRI